MHDDSERAKFIRFVINGLFATAIHFTIFSVLYEIVGLPSAAISNFIAAIFGITASFLGNRYFVFQQRDSAMRSQGVRFLALYGAIACLHAGILYLWTDLLGLDYRLGFILATGCQIILSYFGNRFLVFNK